MTNRRKRWRCLGWVLLTLLIASQALVFIQAYSFLTVVEQGDRTLSPERLRGWALGRTLLTGVRLPRARAFSQPAEHGWSAESVALAGSDGIRLDAWLDPGTASAPIVALFHGYGSEKSALLDEATVFRNLGCGVCLVDFRASGESSGRRTTIGFQEAEDVRTVYDCLRERFPGRPILLYGESMGAAAILRSIAVHGLEPDGIVLVSVFDNFLRTLGHRFTSAGLPAFPAAQMLLLWSSPLVGGRAWTHNPVDYAAHVRCPALFIHGAHDPRARLEDGCRVYEATPGPKHFLTFTRSGHQDHRADDPVLWESGVKWLLGLVPDAVPPP